MRNGCEVENVFKNVYMKKMYHLSLSSPDEALFRSHGDYHRAFNCYAIALLKSGSSSYADAFMSNHLHTCITSKDIKQFCYSFRIGYSMYMNNKYHRRGKLGEDNVFILEVDGIRHILALLSYIFRNALHHGVSPTPFAYPYSSANVIFSKELGKNFTPDILPKEKMWRYLPKNLHIDIPFRMDTNGMFLREDVTEVREVELLYGTPRNFLFYMNRLSDTKWSDEQKEDNVKGEPITIGSIEKVDKKCIDVLIRNEYGRGNYKKMSDIDLCELIDSKILYKYGVGSVYLLTRSQKNDIGNDLLTKYKVQGVTKEQIIRCLAYNYCY